MTDAATGSVLSTVNPDELRFPASLTKMMTLYMTFEAVRDRRLDLAELVPVSQHAASMAPSKLGLLPGTRITVQQAIMALVTKSANDAAAALGEMLGADEDRFAQMMTLRARALGMSRTVFRNASGLPDIGQVTTARDLALLARHLIQDFPDQYFYFSIQSFAFQRKVIPNHDRMLITYPGADGIKTGYTEASGFNLATSAVRGDVRLIGVVLGAARAQERDVHMAALLDSGFEQMGVPVAPAARVARGGDRLQLFSAAQAATLPPSPVSRPALLAVSIHGRAGKTVAHSGPRKAIAKPALARPGPSRNAAARSRVEWAAGHAAPPRLALLRAGAARPAAYRVVPRAVRNPRTAAAWETSTAPPRFGSSASEG